LASAIFDGGAKKAALAQSEAGYAKALAAYRLAALGALGEAEDALDQARRAGSEAALRDQSAALAGASAQAAREQYREGAISGFDLQSALAAEIAAMRQASDARARLLQAQVAIARTFAGSIWSQAEPVPEPSALLRKMTALAPRAAPADPGAALPVAPIAKDTKPRPPK
jgi:outer membrane protein TolC